MESLSRRQLSRAVLIAVLLAHSEHAAAQVPAFHAPEPAPAVTAPANESQTEPALPEPPAPPPGASPVPGSASASPEGSTSPSAPFTGSSAPAKADVLAPPRVEPVEGDEADEAEPRPRRRWYGWQTLLVDAAWLTLLLGSVALDGSGNDSDFAVGTALLTYEFAPGIIHFVHRNPGRGFGSMGVRLGLPLAGAFLGASAASGCDDYLCEASGAGLGLLLGMGGAIAIDAVVFAYDDTDARRPAG